MTYGQGGRWARHLEPLSLPPAALRAVVTPRACAVPDGEPLPLHQHVRRILDRRFTGLVNVFGPRGAGKTTALEHLAAVLPPGAPVWLVDGATPLTAPLPHLVAQAAKSMLVVLATRRRTDRPHLAAFRMAPWTDDDVIEYLLTVCRDRCASVMARVKDAPDRSKLGGSPELWGLALPTMAADDSVATPADAIRHLLASVLGDESVRRLVTAHCLRQALSGPGPDAKADAEGDADDPPACIRAVDARLARWVAHRPVQVLLAAQRMVWDLAAGDGEEHLDRVIPQDLMAEVAGLAAFRQPVIDVLRKTLQTKRARHAHPAAASILHATNTGWVPSSSGCKPSLCGARLAGAAWRGADLSRIDLSAAELGGAVLYEANLDDANISSAELAGAFLRRASMRKLRAMHAILSGADLSEVAAAGADFASADLAGADLSGATLAGADLCATNLTRACLRGADLSAALLNGTKLDGADLSAAELMGARITGVDFTRLAAADGASFFESSLVACDLQGLQMPQGAVFQRTAFVRCDLAGSVLPGADLRGAAFHRSGLANVCWEGADLRGADFRGAVFHTGSSRSGLVDSTIASEGTRTGFYTDEYDDRAYKPPEDLRKANLCGTDLRGAKLGRVDFYLVDLRGATYTVQQAAHFRRCGAIL